MDQVLLQCLCWVLGRDERNRQRNNSLTLPLLTDQILAMIRTGFRVSLSAAAMHL